MSNIRQRIADGKAGKYQGLDNGLDRINNYIFNFQRKCKYLIGGMSGCYKTMITDYMVFTAIKDAINKGIPIDVDYYSFEIDRETKECNLLSNIAFQKYGRVIEPERIKGLGDFRLNKEQAEIIDNCYSDLEDIWSKVNFMFTPINPTGAYYYLWEKAEKDGIFEYGDEYINDKGKKKKKILRYIPNNPDKYRLVVTDHVYYWKKERGFTTKEVIDKWGEFGVELRNLFGYTFIDIQQFNDGLSSVERAKLKGVDLSPQMTDFKDTRNLFQDKQYKML